MGEYNGVNSLFLRTLIEKKYALPFRVMDALVFHFLRFKNEKRVLPVLWHQCFLSFERWMRWFSTFSDSKTRNECSPSCGISVFFLSCQSTRQIFQLNRKKRSWS